ncbi:MAG: divalent-cation tolerance protein CutA [Hadesarchaea archaeon]|nr:MAG: divalent-cation tolerance protein CutA [Hadesarchaea archaeon]TEU13617.1 MAG: divalent-cation tolerance protein CutA [Hadesarchaea archaeon]
MFCVVLTTVKDRAEAKRLAERLVSEKLAACVSAVPNVTSVYRWRGKVERAREVLVVVKTSMKKLDRLIPRIKELHSYEVPEILALRIERGLPEYLKWISESLR